jgi:hypothetical protein
MHNANLVFPYDPGETRSSLELVRLLQIQNVQPNIMRQIILECLCAFRWANQMQTKILAIQLAKESQDMFLCPSPNNGICKMQNGNELSDHVS